MKKFKKQKGKKKAVSYEKLKIIDRVLDQLFKDVGPVLKIPEAARICQMSLKTFNNILSSGKGPVRLGRGRNALIEREELREWLRQRWI